MNTPLFPPQVHVAQSPILEAAFEDLHPAERELIARAVDKRRNEFATGRTLARDLLTRLGVPDAPLLAGERRAPIWPQGVKGTISHANDWCMVALTTSSEIASIGVDVESSPGLAQRLWRRTLTETEQSGLESLPQQAAEHRAMQVFCAKEALYKAQFPLTQSWLGFHGAEIELHPDSTFRIAILDDEVRRKLGAVQLNGVLEVGDRICAAVTVRGDANP